ncbi:hypothetical protein [Haloterrigena turkmenica]|uniref:hypothetical protein n=1 Tax=Haloterrigena turkmenica TaxID=62320 RepID=UPI0011D14C26|nr:hypothetical protein [Haloterrigena turkmenica]
MRVDSRDDILPTIISISYSLSSMLASLLGRCFGIGVLLVGLFGLFVLGGTGWTLDAAVAGDSVTIDEIGMFQDVNLDPGSEYRSGGPASVGGSSTAESTMTAAVVGDSIPANALFAPDDRSEAIHIGGLRFLYVISLVGAVLVAARALVGWRIEASVLALEPRQTVPVSSGEKMVPQPTRFRERRSRSRE